MRIAFFFLLQMVSAIMVAQSADSTAILKVDSLIQVSRDLTAQNDFDKALEVNAVAEQIALEKLGRESAAYGSCAFNRGRVYDFSGNIQEAEKWYLESKEIREKALGREHPDCAWSLDNLAYIYIVLGSNEKAEAFYLESKTIREKALGREHPDYAVSLHNLAILYHEQGNYEKAEEYYLQAKEIREKTLGREHPDYAWSLNNLAVLNRDLGNYEKAEALYLQCKEIREKTQGVEHPDYASSLNNLAILYHELGNYNKAEEYYLQSKEIREKTLGREHPYFAGSLNNLAILYHEQGNYKEAEVYYLQSKEIREKTLDHAHPDYASSLNNLAVLYRDMGDYEKAEPLYQESKEIREKTLGREHPGYASCLHNLAVFYRDLANNNKAEAYYLEAKEIWEKTLGRDHQDYARCLYGLSTLYETQSRYTEGTPLLAEELSMYQKRMVASISFLSEQELGQFTLSQQGAIKLNSCLFKRPVNQLDILPALSFDQSLFIKGFLMQAAIRLRQLTGSSPEAITTSNDLKDYRRRIAQELSLPIAERKDVEELVDKANALEKELARTVTGYAEAMRQVQWQEVQAALPADAVALEFIHFQVNFPSINDSVMYAALLLGPGAQQPEFIPLFEEKELDLLLDGDRERKADFVNDLYAWADRGMVKLGSEKKSLYELIWAKIQGQLPEGIKTIYYSPSGVLHRLNLGALAIDEETIISDRYNMVALNSTRQLVIPATVTEPTHIALLVGGVNFEVDTLQSTLEETSLISSSSTAGIWSEAGTRGGSWSSLTWTEKEVERISTTLTTSDFSTIQYTGAEATEEVIKAICSDAASPRILHIATHGFFFPDPKVAGSSTGQMNEQAVFRMSDHPLIRSGLLLSGANYAWSTGKPWREDMEDGILTAYEISQMNLSNTELVVLSACETGLGDIQGNEGVYGLQRAFKIAGAKYLIMSLWQVPDRETMEFMTAFYKNWLPSDAEALDGKENKMTIPDAFRKTQREMRDRFFNPYSWAGFVLVE